MINNRVEFSKKDFSLYNDFQKNIDICKRHIVEIDNKCASVTSDQNGDTEILEATEIETIQKTMHEKCKQALAKAIIDDTLNMFIISMTIELCAGVVDCNIHSAVFLTILHGMSQEKAGDCIAYSRPQVSRFLSRFFENLECKKMYELAVEQSKEKFRNLTTHNS